MLILSRKGELEIREADACLNHLMYSSEEGLAKIHINPNRWLSRTTLDKYLNVVRQYTGTHIYLLGSDDDLLICCDTHVTGVRLYALIVLLRYTMLSPRLVKRMIKFTRRLGLQGGIVRAHYHRRLGIQENRRFLPNPTREQTLGQYMNMYNIRAYTDLRGISLWGNLFK